ncbi:MAG: ATP-binding protein [Chitinophagaceae bacterium]
MLFLDSVTGGSSMWVMLMGTFGMLTLAIGMIVFIIFHQRRVIRYQIEFRKMEETQQQMLLTASIRMQDEERQRLAADLHDDAGPLLATARLYLNDNLVNQDKEVQSEHISGAKSIIDDTIQLIRNISHSLMPPTLKNFGLESAMNDSLNKIGTAGSISTSCKFFDYNDRLDLETEQIIYRVMQELLNNILKHSRANFIHVSQDISGDAFCLHLKHDGKGLTQEIYETQTKSSGGLGLKNIQSRLKVLAGKISFYKDDMQNEYKVTIEIPHLMEKMREAVA